MRSASQPQPNDRGEIKAFVERWVIFGAALAGPTSSPTWGMRLDYVVEKIGGENLDRSANLRLQRRFTKMGAWQSIIRAKTCKESTTAPLQQPRKL